jgi:uncharacterized damage-inducible protein DinB
LLPPDTAEDVVFVWHFLLLFGQPVLDVELPSSVQALERALSEPAQHGDYLLALHLSLTRVCYANLSSILDLDANDNAVLKASNPWMYDKEKPTTANGLSWMEMARQLLVAQTIQELGLPNADVVAFFKEPVSAGPMLWDYFRNTGEDIPVEDEEEGGPATTTTAYHVFHKKHIDFIDNFLAGAKDTLQAQAPKKEAELRGELLRSYHAIQARGDEETLHRCHAVWLAVHAHHYAEPFHMPVNLEHFPDYLQYVTHPMDLSTVEKKLRDGCYFRTDAAGGSAAPSRALEVFDTFAADMRLIFRNCMTANSEGSEISAYAKELLAYFELVYANWVAEAPATALRVGQEVGIPRWTSPHMAAKLFPKGSHSKPFKPSLAKTTFKSTGKKRGRKKKEKVVVDVGVTAPGDGTGTATAAPSSGGGTDGRKSPKLGSSSSAGGEDVPHSTVSQHGRKRKANKIVIPDSSDDDDEEEGVLSGIYLIYDI